MSLTLDLGRRIELVPMDPHFADITVALYRQRRDRSPEYIVHSYSGKEGTPPRLNFIRNAVAALGGLERVEDRLRFPCGAPHHAAVRRTFLEACKLATGSRLEPKPLAVPDKKLERTVTITSLGSGLYELGSEGPPGAWTVRIQQIAAGFVKLAEMERIAGQPHQVRFDCGRAHDALVGLLLPRALNVRASLRDEELAAARGVLAAPSAQK